MPANTRIPRWSIFVLLAFSILSYSGCDNPVVENPCKDIDCNRAGECRWTADKVPYCVCHPDFVRPPDNPTTCVGGMQDDKPVIYLYPETLTRVRVRFSRPEELTLTVTYPKYPEDGWDVLAYPDGTLEDPVTGRQYYTLFWEGYAPDPPIPSEGFIVAGVDTVVFLEEILEQLGLNDIEANEFIIFWLPILQQNPHNHIFFSTDEWVTAVPLEVTPAPDTVIRFSMRYWPLNEPPERIPVPQVFSPPPRIGFTLVEWGGSRLVPVQP